MEFKQLLSKALPWIGAAATGNVPVLVSMAAKEVSEVLGFEVPATAADVGAAVANATPEQLARLREMELTFQERMQALGFSNTQEMAKLGLQETQAYISDTADARHAHAQNDKVFWLGIAVLTTFAAVMAASLYGSFQLLTGGITLRDVSVVAAVSGFVGTIVGYAAANAQQVIAYFFGSSKGSKDKTDALASAVRDIGNIKK